jgi:putative pyruvate formate lyase activating enzyme
MTEIFLDLQEQGAHNINLVTPEHFVPLLVPALRMAKDRGLSIPVVYNTGSYERVEAVKALEGLVDVWLPDLKYVSAALSARHTGASDYFQYASAAIAEMVRQCPEPVFSDGSHTIDCPDDADDPLMVHGVLVRHLALPGCGEDSRAVLRYLHETYGDRIYISIMSQYTPVGKFEKYPELSRRLTTYEYGKVVKFAQKIGIRNGFLQSGEAAKESFIPSFDGLGI